MQVAEAFRRCAGAADITEESITWHWHVVVLCVAGFALVGAIVTGIAVVVVSAVVVGVAGVGVDVVEAVVAGVVALGAAVVAE